jgi:hypothetical protein
MRYTTEPRHEEQLLETKEVACGAQLWDKGDDEHDAPWRCELLTDPWRLGLQQAGLLTAENVQSS